MMPSNKKVFAIVGSASANSSNLKLIEKIAALAVDQFHVSIFTDLKSLPHFDPELSADHPPQPIIDLRKAIAEADGLIICTPEYVYSIPSGLKNAIEWCIATTVFSDKPIGLITAAAGGQKAHEELQLIMRTALTKFTEETTLLIQGVKGKFDAQGDLIHTETNDQLQRLVNALNQLMDKDFHLF